MSEVVAQSSGDQQRRQPCSVTGNSSFCWQQGVLEAFRTERPFLQSLASAAMDIPSRKIGGFRNNSAILLFYLSTDGPVTILRSAKKLREFLTGQNERIALTLQQYATDACHAAPEVLPEPLAFVLHPVPWVKTPPDDDWVAWRVTGTRSTMASGEVFFETSR